MTKVKFAGKHCQKKKATPFSSRAVFDKVAASQCLQLGKKTSTVSPGVCVKGDAYIIIKAISACLNDVRRLQDLLLVLTPPEVFPRSMDAGKLGIGDGSDFSKTLS
ncbi:hypothetical protein BaRGS_00037964 [Batillaria attramentaria]|uniref:Uncharacterized protein n=1 Tax=Batillaria attramentaria TaxID=370345 RepID=A0ABD0J760_9CAEN